MCFPGIGFRTAVGGVFFCWWVFAFATLTKETAVNVDNTAVRPCFVLMINPTLLASEVCAALNEYVGLVEGDVSVRRALARRLAQDHAKDFAAARAEP